MKWCRSDRKRRSHMKSLTLWHEPDHDFIKKGYRHGTLKRMIRLAGDWALLKVAKQYVSKFARDQDAFFDAFTRAYTKVINQGYDDGELAECGGGGGDNNDNNEEGDGEGDDNDNNDNNDNNDEDY